MRISEGVGLPRFLGHGRLRARQSHGQAHGRAEDDEFDEDEAPELDRRRGGPTEAGDDEPTMPEADESEQDRRERLRDDDLPVGGHEVVEVLHPQHRVDDTGVGDDDEGEEGDRGVAGDERRQLRGLRELRTEQRDDREPAEPQADTEEVEADAVDGLRVTGRRGGVAHEASGIITPIESRAAKASPR